MNLCRRRGTSRTGGDPGPGSGSVPKMIVLMTFLLAAGAGPAFSQQRDTSTTIMATGGAPAQVGSDTVAVHEVSPLDITRDRGLYIVTPDGKMQLRILGSVRYAMIFDLTELPVTKTFNTYYIPTGNTGPGVPSYTNSLDQTRLGFEITRYADARTMFVRLETDFNGPNGQFRIRHAYGQMGELLLGQTWSLFCNVSSQPTMVDDNGPTGNVKLRTPQVRYGGLLRKELRWAAALEYSRTDANIPQLDSAGLSFVQFIPDVTGRIVWEGGPGVVQFSSILTTLSAKDINNEVYNRFGIGGSLSGTVNLADSQSILFQGTYGHGISHFITTFGGTGQDALYNPETGEVKGVDAFGGFLSYGREWTEKVSSYLSVGYARIFNETFQPDDAYRNSLSVSADGFWKVIDGARVGLEAVYGQRWNKNGETGHTGRIWALFYYDF
jgi:hypothetical protein